MNKTEITNKALLIKMRIVDVLTRAMLRANLDYVQLSKRIRVPQIRIKELLSATSTSLDLFDLIAVADTLGIGVTVRSGSNIIYRRAA